MNNSDMPAMPVLNDTEAFTLFLEGIKGGRNYGLTKREHFAAMAMQGWLSSFDAGEEVVPSSLAEFSVEIADALLAALEKQ